MITHMHAYIRSYSVHVMYTIAMYACMQVIILKSKYATTQSYLITIILFIKHVPMMITLILRTLLMQFTSAPAAINTLKTLS